jgi:FAD/FMN-containing dehydrogenase
MWPRVPLWCPPQVMRDIKRLLDPHMIMNPYKTIPFGDEGE